MATRAQLVAQARAAATAAGIDPNIFERQIDQESNFNPTARSSAGALGIAQMIPAMAKQLGIDPMDPKQALPAAAHLMATYLRQFGSYALALAAYNAGPRAVQKYGGVPPYDETESYISAILGNQATKGETQPTGGAAMPTPPMTLEQFLEQGKEPIENLPAEQWYPGQRGGPGNWQKIQILKNGEVTRWYRADKNSSWLRMPVLMPADEELAKKQTDEWKVRLRAYEKEVAAYNQAQAQAQVTQAKKGPPNTYEWQGDIPLYHYDSQGDQQKLTQAVQDTLRAERGLGPLGVGAQPKAETAILGGRVLMERQPILLPDGSESGSYSWAKVAELPAAATNRRTSYHQAQDGSWALYDDDTGAVIAQIGGPIAGYRPPGVPAPDKGPSPTDRLNAEKLRRELLGQQLALIEDAQRTIQYIRDKIATGEMTAKQGSQMMDLVNRNAEATLRGTSPWAIESAYRQNRLAQQQMGTSLLNQRLSSGTALMNSILSSAGAAMMPKGLSSLGISPVAMAQGFADRMQGGPGVSEYGRKLLEGLGSTQAEAGQPGPAIDFSPLDPQATDMDAELAKAKAQMEALRQQAPQRSKPMSPGALWLD